jgi:hypothetical protein
LVIVEIICVVLARSRAPERKTLNALDLHNIFTDTRDPPLPKWDSSAIVRSLTQSLCLHILRSEEKAKNQKVAFGAMRAIAPFAGACKSPQPWIGSRRRGGDLSRRYSTIVDQCRRRDEKSAIGRGARYVAPLRIPPRRWPIECVRKILRGRRFVARERLRRAAASMAGALRCIARRRMLSDRSLARAPRAICGRRPCAPFG